MKSMSLLTTAIAVYRNMSTKATSKTTNLPRKICAKKKNWSIKFRTTAKWTSEQEKIISKIKDGSSVFITGSAGTGKTFLLEHIIEVLENIHGDSHISVTATTGVAACALKGQTLHSFAGIGLGAAPCELLLEKVRKDKRSYKRWKSVKALVIDEVSMLPAELFDKLEFLARKTRKINKTWGGIQLVVCGDFLQLPPIIDKQTSSNKEFAFEADCWNSSFDSQFELTKVFRQSDFQLIKLLQGMRTGKCDSEDLKFLKQSCSLAKPADPSVVQLYPRRADVDRVNEVQLKRLGGDQVIYRAVDSGIGPWRKQLKLGIAPETVVLCEGARVMLIKNLDTEQQLVNGAAGTISGFITCKKAHVNAICTDGLLPVVKFDSGLKLVIQPEEWSLMNQNEVVATRKQVPLILAWALSIHKCQGMTLDKLHADLTKTFGFGMVYVALSRVRSLDGLHLSGFNPSKKIRAHPKVLRYYRSFSDKQDNKDEDDGV